METYDDLRGVVCTHAFHNSYGLSAVVEFVELRVNPTHYETTFGNLSKAIDKLTDACREAEGLTDLLEVGLILTVDWSATAEEAKRVASAAARCRDRRIVGFGITGDDRRGKPETFREAARIAHEAGLIVTADSGLYAPSAHIEKCVRLLQADRIGHGLTAANSPRTLELLAENQVAVEMFPGAHAALRGLSRKKVPVRTLFDAGIPVIIGSLDTMLFGTTLETEYEDLRSVDELSDRQIAVIAANSIVHSGQLLVFKQATLKGLGDWWNPYNTGMYTEHNRPHWADDYPDPHFERLLDARLAGPKPSVLTL